MADALEKATETILAANQKDLAAAKAKGTSQTMLDRLLLTEQRITEMANGIREVAQLPDPIGAVDKMWRNADDLLIGQQRVPLGVIGIIYEARPNVTTDAASLCFKSGNAVILRGGKEAFHSNQVLVTILQEALAANGHSRHAIQFIEDTSHETAAELMRLTDYLDVLIPRGRRLDSSCQRDRHSTSDRNRHRKQSYLHRPSSPAADGTGDRHECKDSTPFCLQCHRNDPRP